MRTPWRLSPLPLVLAASCVLEGAPVDDGVLRLAAEPALDDMELEFLRILNEYRAENGAPELTPVAEIDAAADGHSEDMGERDYFSHEAAEPAPFGVTPFERMCHFGFGPACDSSTTMGENIAAGFADARSVFEAWRNSPGHDANMREGAYRAIGIGRVVVPGSLYGTYWTTNFAGVAPECPCVDGQRRSCETDSCGPGVSICSACEFGPCEVPSPGEEICGDQFDNDCDGEVDEESDCGPRCEPGVEECDGVDNDCDGLVDEDAVCDITCFPLDEVCDGLDNDCDLTVDEGCPCQRRPSQPLCGIDVGQCSTGTQECDFSAGGEEGVLTECRGAIVPAREECDGVDNDCDGLVDEAPECDSGEEGCGCVAPGAARGRPWILLSRLL